MTEISRDAHNGTVAISTNVYIWAFALCLVSTLATWAIFQQYRDVDVWQSFRGAEALAHPVPSDPVFVASVFRTRANTWSNLAYVFVGIFAIVLGLDDLRRGRRGGYLVETGGMGIFFGVSCVYLGIASGIFHASLTHWGQQLDVASMYSTLVALIALNLGRLRPHFGRVAAWPALIVAAVIVDALLYRYKWSMSSIVVLPGLILCVAAFAVGNRYVGRGQMQARWFYVGMACMVLSVACRRLDSVGPLADPGVWLTGHALWHVFTAASLGCMYVYYRTERVG